ncbi:hypothetical protein TTHERM_00290860 (macronuclear) [Tetrahymena thermophila SB210]|uniref:Uncharacterized protein n=1 Tax=Tetrahymena thermophila (strain SB210) TaxID=312017 RepID=I7MKH9_TETTS|nr:hypothetical protein TTHERM_00290860 [Tetrahymena thermophila SB210]EAR98458.2 hypothetical protein TTHERM_00290860 [Tetrahymena thermophila SB210]|eukprot:XP_001018703.2 hypothetical protein TTHERM_00290860 [Tetrahymena thermophila SB210]
MEFINQNIKQDEFLLVNLKGNFYVMEYLEGEDEFGQKQILNNAQSKGLAIYYINVVQKLREKFNKQKIQQQLQSILNQQIYYKLIETDEANEMARMNMYSDDSSEDLGIDDYTAAADESFDASKQITFKIAEYAKIREICKNIDIFIESLLSQAITGTDNPHFSSTSGFVKDQENDAHCLTYSYVDDSIYNLYIRLVKPQVLDKILANPLKVNLNLLHIDDEGFSKSPSYSYFNDIQNSFRKLNIQLEVKNLQLNIYFKKRKKESNQNPKKFFQNYMNYVKKVFIDMDQIYTKQILEIYVQFNDSQSQYLTQHINQYMSSTFQQDCQNLSNKFDINKYQIQVLLHNTLNAVILNDIKVNLVNTKSDQFIKKIYYSNELKSNWFQFLGLNNNISFIHTQQFNDSSDIKYVKYKFKTHKKNKKDENHQNNAVMNYLNYQYNSQNNLEYLSQSSMTSLSGFSSDNQLFKQDFENFSSFEELKKKSGELSGEEQEYANFLSKNKKNKNVIRHNIFDIYKNLIETHFRDQTFVFCAYDTHSKQLQSISKNTCMPFNIYELIHAKTSIMLSILAYKLHVAEFISYKPNLYIWDQYLE